MRSGRVAVGPLRQGRLAVGLTRVIRDWSDTQCAGRFAKPSYMGSELRTKAAGEVLTAKQATEPARHRPGVRSARREGSPFPCIADPPLKGIQSIEEVGPCFSCTRSVRRSAGRRHTA